MAYYVKKEFISDKEEIEETLNRVISYLIPLIPLANAHTVDFIISNIWKNVVPDEIRREVDTRGTDSILKEFWCNQKNSLSKFHWLSKTFTIENTQVFKDIQTWKARWGSGNKSIMKVKECMSEKKLHEVKEASSLISDLALATDANLVVDIGSGKGYLTSILVLHYQLRVLGIDCKPSNIEGAAHTATKLEKRWKSSTKFKNKADIHHKDNVKDQLSSNQEYYKKYKCGSSILDDRFKQNVQIISESTDIQDIIKNQYPDLDNLSVSLVGLHTCGNLAVNCLRMFVKNKSIMSSLMNIGCCYHLLTEKFVPNSIPDSNYEKFDAFGFPSSSFLENKQFWLGRDARMSGTQNPEKIFNCKEVVSATKPLFYRALLQKLMTQIMGAENVPSGVGGRFAHKCKSFEEYAHRAFCKLGVESKLEDVDLTKFMDNHLSHWEQLKIFFLLKTSLASVIETVILLDRLLFLYEQGVQSSFVTKIFDPVESPRCYAIISINDVL